LLFPCFNLKWVVNIIYTPRGKLVSFVSSSDLSFVLSSDYRGHAGLVDQVDSTMRLTVIWSKKLFVYISSFLVFVVQTPHDLLTDQVANFDLIFFRRLVELFLEFFLSALVQVDFLFVDDILSISTEFDYRFPFNDVSVVKIVSIKVVADSERKFKFLLVQVYCA
jgi:hypothetical protein